MAIVNGTIEALCSKDRFNLVKQGNLGWEIQDNRDFRTVSIHFDETEAREAYAKLVTPQ